MPRIGNDAVREKTGKGWEEWFAVLDEEGAAELPHADIARALADGHGVSGWWAQTITVEYERARGLRERHERPEGYEVGATKSIAAPPEAVWRAWEDETLRERWLPGAQVAIRTATKPKTMRLDWGEGGRLAVYLDRSGEQTRLAVQHEKLPDREAAERWKTFWRERVAALKDIVEKEER
jgi:Domain of unknown function (DUF4287)/Activator of Hsp90 ATPase homolog 1-like protein